MQVSQDLAIILRKIRYEDRHLIVTALTENHGVLTAMARNAIQSRRFGPALELFAASTWQFSEKNQGHHEDRPLHFLKEALPRRTFEGIRSDFSRLSVASAVNEIVLRAAHSGEKSGELFKLYSNTLAAIEEMDADRNDALLLDLFLLRILYWFGCQPQLDHCETCKKTLSEFNRDEKASPLIAQAGWICEQCREVATGHLRKENFSFSQHRLERFSLEALAELALTRTFPIRKAFETLSKSPTPTAKTEHQKLFGYLFAVLTYHVPGFDRTPLKSLRFLDLQGSDSGSTAQPAIGSPPQNAPLPLDSF